MNIWIMRHGEAGFNAPNDAARSLTDSGIKSTGLQGQWLGQHLINQNIQLDKIIVSPYLRAQQTLEQLILGMQAVKFSQNFATITEIWDEITPDGNPYTVENYLDFLRSEGAKQVLVISHLPLVFDLALSLTHHQANIAFQTATIAEIDWHQTQGNLLQVKYP